MGCLSSKSDDAAEPILRSGSASGTYSGSRSGGARYSAGKYDSTTPPSSGLYGTDRRNRRGVDEGRHDQRSLSSSAGRPTDVVAPAEHSRPSAVRVAAYGPAPGEEKVALKFPAVLYGRAHQQA